MVTWSNLITAVQREIRDETGTFHPSASVTRYLEWSEAALNIRRVLYERTTTVTLAADQPFFTIHADTPTPALSPSLPLFIIPLRITLSNTPLRPTSIATLSRAKADWWSTPGTPESYAMVGSTMIAFYPVQVSSTDVVITYLAYPPTTTTTPAAGTSPVIADEHHTALELWGQALALGKEAEYQKAVAKLNEFVRAIGIEREVRLLSGASVKAPETIQEIVTKVED